MLLAASFLLLATLFAFFERCSSMLRPARPLILNHDENKTHLVSLHPFIILLKFLFFPLRASRSEFSFATKPCLNSVQLRLCWHQNFDQPTTPHLQPTPNHRLAKTSLRTATGLPTNQQTWETPFLQRWQQWNPLNKQHKYLQILAELVHLK